MIDHAHPCWLHLNYTHPDSAEWLASTLYCQTTCVMPWQGKPAARVSRMGDGALITLRCINGSTDERPDQLVAMRVIWMMGLLFPLGSVKCWRWMTVNDLKEGTADRLRQLAGGCPMRLPITRASLSKSCTIKLSIWKITCSTSRYRRAVSALLRKQLIVMRRYMTPQRDVYARLASERLVG